VGLQIPVTVVKGSDKTPSWQNLWEKHARTFSHNLLFLKKNKGFKTTTNKQVLLQDKLEYLTF